MRKKTMRNIKFGLKVFAICGTTAVTFLCIRGVYKSAKTEASHVTPSVTASKNSELQKKIVHTLPETATPIPESKDQKKSIDLNKKETYLLAKLAMAEAESEDTEGKALVIRVVLNRVEDDGFPDTIKKVIFQKDQFSPISNGRFDKVEPDKDCYKALELIQKENWDESCGALYFESKSKSDWHRKNLRFLFKHGNHYFYTEKE